MELIVNINKEFGYTFVITSHDMNFEKIASNIFKIENKKINKIKWMKIIHQVYKDY